MLKLLLYKYLYALPILLVCVFYSVPALGGVLFDGSSEAARLLLLSFGGGLVYFIGYKFFCAASFSCFFSGFLKVRLKWQAITLLVFLVYFSVIIYACFTAPGIALVAALKGVPMGELSGLREEFLRTREGWEKGLNYIYSICITSLVPFAIAKMFVVKARFRFFMLFAFLLSLALTLEKGRTVVAMLPLVVLYVNSGDHKKAYRAIYALVLIVGLISIVARGGLTSNEATTTSAALEGVPEQYNLFKGESGQGYYIMNRVGYIPYITAIDWLNYREQVLRGDDVNGRSIGIVAFLLDQEKINLEREVFAFQWGQNDTGTGSSNTAYFVDAYLNFGVFGVIIYSLILSFIVRIVVISNDAALISCLSIPLLYVCFTSLPAVLFSGGLGFLFILALMFKIDSREVIN